MKIADIKDSSSQTIALAEMIDSGIHWMEPRDLSFDEMSFEINDPARVSISSGHGSAQGENSTHGAQIAFADGSIFFLQDGVSPNTVRALLTRNGGEKIEELDLYPPKQSGK